MKTLVLAAALAAAFILTLGVARNLAFRRLASGLFRLLLRPLVGLERGVSAVADFCLPPAGQRGRIAPGRYLLWIVLGALPLIAWRTVRLLPTTLPAWADPGYLLIAGAVFHALVLTAWCVIAYDDFDVMDGAIAGDARRFGRGARVARRTPVALVSAAFFLAYAAAIALWLMQDRGIDLVAAAPGTGSPVADGVLIGLSALPTRMLVAAGDWLFQENALAVFQPNAAARAYALSFGVVGGLLAAAGVATFIVQRWRVHAFVTQIARSRDDDYTFLVDHVRRAPEIAKKRVLVAAIYERNAARQSRLFEAARDMGIHAFPLALCRRLELFSRESQQAGLDRANEFFREHAAEFDGRTSRTILRKTRRVLSRGKLEPEPLRRLLRLMLTVATTRKAAMKLSQRQRDRICAAIKMELERPRATSDAALRSYLRELQNAVGAPASARVVPLPTDRRKAGPQKLPEAPPIYGTARLKPRAERPASPEQPRAAAGDVTPTG